MRGHEAILAARMRGLRPTKTIHVDVSLRSDQPRLLGYNECDLAPGIPGTRYVCLGVTESARLADWGWCIGLNIHVDGDDEARVRSAFERIVAAGASVVLGTWSLGERSIWLEHRA